MADLDELLSEGLISPRALARLNTIYGGSSSQPIAAGSDDANTMTHWPPPANPVPAMEQGVQDWLTERAPPSPPGQNFLDALTDSASARGYTNFGVPSTWNEAAQNPWVDVGLAAILGGVGARGGGRPMPIRRFGIPPAADPPISSYRNTNALQAHPAYEAAKAGDPEAAVRLVQDIVNPGTVQEAARRFGPAVTYVPVHAEEAAGRNRIPYTLANYYATLTGADVAPDIVQATRAYHTGANAIERLIARPLFEGPVQPGRSHVLTDDVSVLGGTLAELANHIQANGGEVAGVVNLVNGSRMPHNVPLLQRVKMVEQRHGQAIQDELGIEPRALTAAETEYLLNFGTSDAFRDRVATARRARSERLRSKGVFPSETEDGGP
jgi:hypothetical protein